MLYSRRHIYIYIYIHIYIYRHPIEFRKHRCISKPLYKIGRTLYARYRDRLGSKEFSQGHPRVGHDAGRLRAMGVTASGCSGQPGPARWPQPCRASTNRLWAFHRRTRQAPLHFGADANPPELAGHRWSPRQAGGKTTSCTAWTLPTEW